MTGPRYQIFSHVFARCYSHNVQKSVTQIIYLGPLPNAPAPGEVCGHEELGYSWNRCLCLARWQGICGRWSARNKASILSLELQCRLFKFRQVVILSKTLKRRIWLEEAVEVWDGPWAWFRVSCSDGFQLPERTNICINESAFNFITCWGRHISLFLLSFRKGRHCALGIGCWTQKVWMVTHKASSDAEGGSITQWRAS